MVSKFNRSHRPVRVRQILLAAACLLGFSIAAHAGNNCPWINEATVSGLLEGNAIGDFNQGSANEPATCTFVSKTSGGSRTLSIHVETTPDAAIRVSSMAKLCGQPAEAIASIGNEAFICTTERNREAVVQSVIGRVRDQVFSISISTSVKGESVVWMADLRTRISIASEQVSGNLF
jgi:hypothetical protein